MIRHLLLIAALPALAACGDAAEEADQPVVDSEVVAPTTADAETLEPSDRSLADPAANSVTSPAPAAMEPAPAESESATGRMDDQYQDYVGQQPAQGQ